VLQRGAQVRLIDQHRNRGAECRSSRVGGGLPPTLIVHRGASAAEVHKNGLVLVLRHGSANVCAHRTKRLGRCDAVRFDEQNPIFPS
jgi:hypothetical protein